MISYMRLYLRSVWDTSPEWAKLLYVLWAWLLLCFVLFGCVGLQPKETQTPRNSDIREQIITVERNQDYSLKMLAQQGCPMEEWQMIENVTFAGTSFVRYICRSSDGVLFLITMNGDEVLIQVTERGWQ